MKEFDLSLSETFEKVPARVLPPPDLLYDDNKTVRVSRGVWRTDRLKFLLPCTAIRDNNSWTILNLNQRTDERALRDLASKLQDTGKNLSLV